MSLKQLNQEAIQPHCHDQDRQTSAQLLTDTVEHHLHDILPYSDGFLLAVRGRSIRFFHAVGSYLSHVASNQESGRGASARYLATLGNGFFCYARPIVGG